MGRAALTPTDLFHLSGEYTPWDVRAAEMAVEFFTRLNPVGQAEFIGMVKEIVAERIVEEVVSFITNQPVERQPAYVPMNNLVVAGYLRKISKMGILILAARSA